MADIQIVMEVLGQKNIESATKSTINLENRIKALDKSLKAGRISEEQFSTALKELRRALDKNGKSWQSNKADIERYVKELQASDAAAKAAIEAQEKLNQQRKLAETVLALQTQKERELAQQQKVAAQEAKAQAAEEERLKMKFVEGHAAMNLYSKELNDLAVARKLNVISAEQQKQKLAQLNKELETGTGRFSSYNLQTGLATKGNNRLGVVTQQAGYQVGDFLVQVQSGTNVMVAFGQQATQMVGTFAMLAKTTKGIAIFSALGVVIPIITAIGAALMRTALEAKSFKDTLDELSDASKELKSDLDLLSDDKLEETYGSLAGRVKELTSAFVGLNSAAELKALFESIDKLKTETKPTFFQGVISSMAMIMAGPNIDAAALEKDFEKRNLNKLGFQIGQDTFNTILEGMKAAAKSGDRETVLRLFQDLVEDATDFGAANEKISAEGIAYLNEMKAALLAVAENYAILNTSAKAATEHNEALKEQAKALDAAGKSQFESLRKAEERQIEILKLEGFLIQAKERAVALARDKAEEEVLSKITADEVLKLTQQEQQALAAAATEAGNQAAEAEKAKWQLDGAKDKAKELAEALRESVSAMDSLAKFSEGLDKALAVSVAKVKAMKAGMDATVAGTVAALRFDLNTKIQNVKSKGTIDAGIIERMFGGDRQTIAALEASLNQEAGLREGLKKGSTADSIKSGTEYIERVLKPEIELRQKSLFLSDEQQKRAKFEFDLRQKLDKYKDKASEKEIAAVMALYDQTVRLERASRLIDYAQGQMEDFFMSVVDGTSTIEDAFKNMLRNIILETYRQAVVKPMAEAGANFLTKLFLRSANGNVFQGGSQVKAFANGGVVSGPTMFPMTSGVGLMGEAGPEAIMPLKRGANGKLGVEMHGGGSQQVVVNQSFNFSANGDESVKKIIAQAAPQIAQMTQQKIMDSRRRGGQMKATFS